MNEKQNWNKHHQLFDTHKKFTKSIMNLYVFWLIDI